MSDHAFLKPRLVGKRFEGHAIPLDVLADFAGLNELLIETAKWEYRVANKRKRARRGFADGLELKITGIEDGSAKPVIELFVGAVATAAAALFPIDTRAYMERARDRVIATIDAAATDKPITLPPQLLAHFNRFGRSLIDGEAVEFREASADLPAIRLDKTTRRKLLLASPNVTEVTDVAFVMALIPDVAQSDSGTIKIELPDGRLIPAPLADRHRDVIFDAAKGFKQRWRVLIDGVGRWGRDGRLLGFESIDDVTPVPPLDFGAQLDDLRVLKDGWFDGDDPPAFAPAALDRLEGLLYENYPADLAPPHLYPTPDGLVRAAWSLAPYEASLEIDLHSFVAYWHVLNLADQTDDAFDLDLNDALGWTRLAEVVRDLPGGSL